MLAAGFSDDDVDRVLWRNPVEFYGQSRAAATSTRSRGRRARAVAPGRTFEGNSILRGDAA